MRLGAWLAGLDSSRILIEVPDEFHDRRNLFARKRTPPTGASIARAFRGEGGCKRRGSA